MSDQSAPPRRLTRSRDDRMLAGVCGGLAAYTGVDPVVFRVVVAVASILGGAGIAAYVIAWLVLPEASDGTSHAESILKDRHRPQVLRIVLYGVAALAIISIFDGPFDRHWGGGGFGLLLLLALGIWLWNREGRWTAPPVPPAPPPPPVPPTRPLVASAATDETTVPVPPPAPDRPPRPPRERSKLTALTLSAAVLAAGVLATVEAADIADVDLAAAFAVCLLVVGAGLLVGALYGRGTGLIGVGVLLTIATAVATVTDVPFRGGAGERDWRPVSLAELDDEYHLGAGEAFLDLSDLELDGQTRMLEVTLGMGELRVLLPPSAVAVDIDGHVGFGQLTVLGERDEGVDLDQRRRVGSGRSGRLELDLRVGMGELEVSR